MMIPLFDIITLQIIPDTYMTTSCVYRALGGLPHAITVGPYPNSKGVH